MPWNSKINKDNYLDVLERNFWLLKHIKSDADVTSLCYDLGGLVFTNNCYVSEGMLPNLVETNGQIIVHAKENKGVKSLGIVEHSVPTSWLASELAKIKDTITFDEFKYYVGLVCCTFITKEEDKHLNSLYKMSMPAHVTLDNLKDNLFSRYDAANIKVINKNIIL